MNRFIIYSPESESFVRIRHGWTSGHPAEVVNSYASRDEAEKAQSCFHSLRDCEIIEVQKTVTFMDGRAVEGIGPLTQREKSPS